MSCAGAGFSLTQRLLHWPAGILARMHAGCGRCCTAGALCVLQRPPACGTAAVPATSDHAVACCIIGMDHIITRPGMPISVAAERSGAAFALPACLIMHSGAKVQLRSGPCCCCCRCGMGKALRAASTRTSTPAGHARSGAAAHACMHAAAPCCERMGGGLLLCAALRRRGCAAAHELASCLTTTS